MSDAAKSYYRGHKTQRAQLDVIRAAVRSLGALAIGGPTGEPLTGAVSAKLRQQLFECLEILNNEKGDSDGS